MDHLTKHVSAPCLNIYEANDANKHASNLSLWSQEYDQFSNGAFYGRINEVVLAQTSVFKEYTNQSLRQQCNINDGGIWLGFSADNNRCRINGLHTQENTIMCRTGQQDFELMTPPNFSVFGIVIDKSALIQAANMQKLALDEIIPSLELLPYYAAGTISTLRYFIEHLLSSQLLNITSRIQEDILISAVIELLMNKQPAMTTRVSYRKRRVTVETIIQYMTTSTYPTTISELCNIANVSRRTLQYSFESILGISPQRFIRLTRLNQIRRELSKPTQTKPIVDIALDYGFYHPGAFSQDYKLLFAESPSITRQLHMISP
ncbi:MAG: helix-turn-helix domain-containing protein [Moritella sp.]|uniref:helix-turn-helix domain-containing protein n=1 Tax=Moritella sp. TaxID=78556 RepID=UPI0029B86405|nr:helix-turn-helix domain-containing protein [Moritella sp.]MDX2321905.1 helix-turn-helix domain-containing protein [Moritella sp.]